MKKPSKKISKISKTKQVRNPKQVSLKSHVIRYKNKYHAIVYDELNELEAEAFGKTAKEAVDNAKQIIFDTIKLRK